MGCEASVLGVGTSGLLQLSFFFFQAEDGIRDVAVTGVQTCALPISPPFAQPTLPSTPRARNKVAACAHPRVCPHRCFTPASTQSQKPHRSIPCREEMEIGRASCRERV